MSKSVTHVCPSQRPTAAAQLLLRFQGRPGNTDPALICYASQCQALCCGAGLYPPYGAFQHPGHEGPTVLPTGQQPVGAPRPTLWSLQEALGLVGAHQTSECNTASLARLRNQGTGSGDAGFRWPTSRHPGICRNWRDHSHRQLPQSGSGIPLTISITFIFF